jgi:hypothetical protein
VQRICSSRESQQQQQQRVAQQPPPSGAAFSVQPGQSALVRLHHPETNNYIGEIMTVHYLERSTMAFELASPPGRYLRVDHYGKVEFADIQDKSSQFIVEVASGGIFLVSAGHIGKTNTMGGKNWYLALSREGALVGNAGNTSAAKWVLIAANPGAAPRRSPSLQEASHGERNPLLEQAYRQR